MYEDGTKEIQTKITSQYNHLKDGGYNATRSKRKKQSDNEKHRKQIKN